MDGIAARAFEGQPRDGLRAQSLAFGAGGTCRATHQQRETRAFDIQQFTRIVAFAARQQCVRQRGADRVVLRFERQRRAVIGNRAIELVGAFVTVRRAR